jgi:hypothetical protein
MQALARCRASLQTSVGMSDTEELRRRVVFRLLRPTAHQLNNDLFVLGGLAELLLSSEADPERRASLESIAAHARSAGECVRLYGALGLPPDERAGPARLEQVLADARALLAQPALAARTQFDVRCAPDLPPAAADGRALCLVAVALGSALVLPPAGRATSSSDACLRLSARFGHACLRLVVTASLPSALDRDDPRRAELAEELARTIALCSPVAAGFGAALRVRRLGTRLCAVSLALDAVSPRP